MTAFVWFGLGIVVVAVLAVTGKERWATTAAAALQERPETPEELATRPGF